jgi:hypothetical protein
LEELLQNTMKILWIVVLLAENPPPVYPTIPAPYVEAIFDRLLYVMLAVGAAEFILKPCIDNCR